MLAKTTNTLLLHWELENPRPSQPNHAFNDRALSDAGSLRVLDLEVLLLLIRIGTGGSVNLLLAVVVAVTAGLGVGDLRLQLELVLVAGGVDVGVQRLGLVLLARGLALDVVLVVERALAVRAGVFVGHVEVVVAADGAAEDEVGDGEFLVGRLLLLGGRGGREGGGCEGDESGGTHFGCVGGWFDLVWFGRGSGQEVGFVG